MTKLNKNPKQKSVEPKILPPTHQAFKLEVNHSCSIDLTREQYNDFVGRELAVKHKEKLVKNVDREGHHQVFILRIIDKFYNRVRAYRSYGGIILEILKEYRSKLMYCWRYKSCIAILMSRA